MCLKIRVQTRHLLLCTKWRTIITRGAMKIIRSGAATPGLHTWDDRLTDYSPAKIAERAQHVRSLLDKVRAMKTDAGRRMTRIDWILFRAQLENVDFGNRILKSERTNPQIYMGECTNAIFSLLKKEYDTPRKRALAATARLKQMPALLKQGLSNLQNPVKLYAQLAIESARSIDSLFNDSLMTLDDGSCRLTSTTNWSRRAMQRSPRCTAMPTSWRSGCRRWWTSRRWAKRTTTIISNTFCFCRSMPRRWKCLAASELARYRALEALLPDPSLADPDPARSKNIPPDQACVPESVREPRGRR